MKNLTIKTVVVAISILSSGCCLSPYMRGCGMDDPNWGFSDSYRMKKNIGVPDKPNIDLADNK